MPNQTSASPRSPSGNTSAESSPRPPAGNASAGSAPGARRFAASDVIDVRELTTIRSERILLPARDGLTHLQFRRYAGCPICNVHLRSVARRHGEILAAGIQEIAVFHSSAEDMLPHQGELPFAVVADPGRELYTAFGVESSVRAVLHPRAWSAPLNPQTWPVVVRGIRAGGSPAPAKGDSALGLPADFLIDPTGLILAAKYGRHASDHWPVGELLRLAAPLINGASTAGWLPERPQRFGGFRRYRGRLTRSRVAT